MKPLLIILALLGCASVSAISQFHSVNAYGQQAVYPSPMHEALFRMMEECTGEQRDFEGIRWFVADSLIETDGGRVWGIWTPERRIVLDGSLWFLPGLVAHEVMHDLYDGPIPQEVERRCTPQISGTTMLRILGQIESDP